MIMNRRKLIGSLATLFVAPAIVRAESLMKVKRVDGDNMPVILDYGDFTTDKMRWVATERYSWAHQWQELYHARILHTGFKVSQEVMDARLAS